VTQYVIQPSLSEIIGDKIEEIKTYLQSIEKVVKDTALDPELYDNI
jgi:hypothetical protein